MSYVTTYLLSWDADIFSRLLRIIQLLHQAVQEFLLGRPHQIGQITNFKLKISDSNRAGGQMDCIVYVLGDTKGASSMLK